MAWTPEHRQVDLPELGFAVDEGLEELIQLCWQRGIGTFTSCIGSGDPDDWHGGDGMIGFTDPNAPTRWEALTNHPVEWNDDDEVATEAEAYFTRDQILILADALRMEH